MENLFDKILGPIYTSDDKFKDILKEFILNKVTNNNLIEYADKMPEEDQIEILKKYINKLKNSNKVNGFQEIYPIHYKDQPINKNLSISEKLNGGITYGDSKCSDSINMNVCTKK